MRHLYTEAKEKIFSHKKTSLAQPPIKNEIFMDYNFQLHLIRRSCRRAAFSYCEGIWGPLKTPSEKKQLCTASAASSHLVVRKHAFDGFSCIYCTYLLFLTQNGFLEVPICANTKQSTMSGTAHCANIQR